MSMKIMENPTVQNAGIATAVGAGLTTIGNYLYQRQALKNPAKMLDTYTRAMTDIATRETKSATIRKIYDAAGRRVLENFNKISDVIKSGKVSNKMLANSAALGALAGASVYVVYRGIKALFTPKAN